MSVLIIAHIIGHEVTKLQGMCIKTCIFFSQKVKRPDTRVFAAVVYELAQNVVPRIYYTVIKENLPSYQPPRRVRRTKPT